MVEKNVEKFIRTLSIFVAIILLIILIVIKVNVPSFKLTYLILSIVGVILFFGAIIFVFRKINLKPVIDVDKEQAKIPKQITLEQAIELVHKALQTREYADYVVGFEKYWTEQRGKNIKSNIFIAKVKGLYENCYYYVLINMHYPNEKKAVLINPSELEVERIAGTLAVYPEDEPNIKRTTLDSALTGVKQTVEEITKPVENKEEKKETEEKEKGL